MNRLISSGGYGIMRCCNSRIRAYAFSGLLRAMRSAFVMPLIACLSLAIASTVAFAQSDSNSLPEDVAAMRDAILDAAQTGEIDEMGVAIELNELSPEFGGIPREIDDPVEALRALISLRPQATGPTNADTTFLATLTAILELPPAKDGDLYIWPYLAARSTEGRSERENADLVMLAKMRGMVVDPDRPPRHYSDLRIEIGSDGTWHFIGYNHPDP